MFLSNSGIEENSLVSSPLFITDIEFLLHLNSLIIPLREKYLELKDQPHYLDEVLALGAEKVRPQAKELLLKIKDLVGISSIS